MFNAVCSRSPELSQSIGGEFVASDPTARRAMMRHRCGYDVMSFKLILHLFDLLWISCRVVVSVSTSRSREVPTSRLGLFSVLAIYVSCQRLPDGHADGAVRSLNGL